MVKIAALVSLVALVTLSGCAPGGGLSSSDAPSLSANCGFDAQAQEVPAEEFFALLEEHYQSRRASPFNYTSSAGEVATVGAFNYSLA